jgi:Ras family protein A
VPIILVGCKADLRNNPNTIEQLRQQQQQPVSTAEGQAVAQKIGAQYLECSARTNEGVREVFEAATRASLKTKEVKEKKKKCVVL